MGISYRTGHRIEEFILLVMLLLDVLGFMGKLPGDIEYIDKLIAFTALAYLFYRMSLTRILFGIDSNLFDLLIILSCSLLVSKNLVAYAWDAVSRTSMLQWFYYFMYVNSELVVKSTFIIGGMLLILVSLYFAIRFRIRVPCLCDVFLSSYDRGLITFLKRFAVIFFLLNFFFVAVFNLAVEWLGIIADDAITIVSIVYLIVIIVKHKERLSAESWLFRVGEGAEKAYNSLTEMFQSKEKVMFGITAMLILHLLTDVSVFLFPYVTSFSEIRYFGELGAGHEPVLYHLINDFLQASATFDKMAVFWVYAANVICVFLLFLLPAYVWYHVYSDRPFSPNAALVSLFYSSLSAFIILPVFRFQKLQTGSFVGVDILTNPIRDFGLIGFTLAAGLIVLAVALVVCILNLFLERVLFAVGIVIAQVFFIYYIFSFSTSAAAYYIISIANLIRMPGSFTAVFIIFYLLVFLCITFLFYTGGMLFFLYKTWKNRKALI